MYRNQSIDLIKLIAMFGVIILHTTLQFKLDNTVIGHILFSMAGISMPLFFMVSGFLMLNKGRDYHYLLRKCIKIVQFVLIITFLLDLLILRTDFSIKRWCIDFIFSFIQQGRFGVFWYFGAIIPLYLAVPLLDLLWNKSTKYYIILCLGFLLMGSIIHDMNIANRFETVIPQTLRFWYWIPYFMVGGLAREIYNKRIMECFLKNIWGGVIVCIYAVYILYYLWAKRQVGQYGIEYLFGSLPCQILSISVFLTIIHVQIRQSRFVSFFSNLFLPVYALHMFVISIVAYLYGKCTLGINSFTALLYYLSVSTVTLGLSWMTLKFPILKRIFKI